MAKENPRRRPRKRMRASTSGSSLSSFEGFTSPRRRFDVLVDEARTDDKRNHGEVPPPVTDATAISDPLATPASQQPRTTPTIVSNPSLEEGRVEENSFPSDVPDHKCDLCDTSLAGVDVWCFSCSKQFCSKPQCLGINEQAIRVLGNEETTPYCCLDCRAMMITSGEEQSREFLLDTLRQTFMMMQIMRRDIEQLRSNALREGIRQSGLGNRSGTGTNNTPGDRGEEHLNPTHPVSDSTLRAEVQNHLKELREREKRSDSIILRGFGAASFDTIKQKFEEICSVIQIETVPLVGLTKIGSTNIYRARVTDKAKRSELFRKAPELRNTRDFKGVYINKDLTYIQRQDMIESRRRAAQRLEGGNGVNRPPRANVRGNAGGNRTNNLRPTNESASPWQTSGGSRDLSRTAGINREVGGRGRGANARGNINRNRAEAPWTTNESATPWQDRGRGANFRGNTNGNRSNVLSRGAGNNREVGGRGISMGGGATNNVRGGALRGCRGGRYGVSRRGDRGRGRGIGRGGVSSGGSGMGNAGRGDEVGLGTTNGDTGLVDSGGTGAGEGSGRLEVDSTDGQTGESGNDGRRGEAGLDATNSNIRLVDRRGMFAGWNQGRNARDPTTGSYNVPHQRRNAWGN